MTRNKKLNAKGAERQGQGRAIPANDSPLAASTKECTTKLMQNMSQDDRYARKRSENGYVQSIAKDTTVQDKQSEHTFQTSQRPRQDEICCNDVQPPLRKKIKRSDQEKPNSGDSAIPSGSNGANGPMETPQFSETSSKHATRQIPSEVQNLISKFDLTPMSVLPSSKIEQKVRNILERVSKASAGDANVKPGVVILRAEAKNVSKMVSIVELSKREIGKSKGTWWQYTKLESQIKELKDKPRKSLSTQRRKTIAACQVEHRSTVAGHARMDVVMEGAGTESVVVEQSNDAGEAIVQEDASMEEKEEEEEEEEDDDDDDDDEPFETMPTPIVNHRAGNLPDLKKKVRAVPIMTIYLARVPVPGLRELYGEQTNTLAP